MPLNEGSSDKAFSDNVRKLLHESYPKKQALAIAYDKKRKAAKKKGRIGPKKKEK